MRNTSRSKNKDRGDEVDSLGIVVSLVDLDLSDSAKCRGVSWCRRSIYIQSKGMEMTRLYSGRKYRKTIMLSTQTLKIYSVVFWRGSRGRGGFPPSACKSRCL